MKATANQASPAHASRVIGPTDGALKYKGLDWLSLAKRTARYPKNKAETAHTKAWDTAEPTTRFLAFT